MSRNRSALRPPSLAPSKLHDRVRNWRIVWYGGMRYACFWTRANGSVACGFETRWFGEDMSRDEIAKYLRNARSFHRNTTT